MSVDHTKNIIEIRNVTFAYTEEEVLKDISLNIHKGDYLGIVGPNGGGKTTLLKIILGLLNPKKGTIKLFGKDIKYFKDWFRIGYVPQKSVNFESHFPLTVREVVTMGRYGKKGLFKTVDREDKKHVKEALLQVDMWEYRDHIIGDLSGGQQQRVFIARALASEPEVIFLDEPTTGIDQETQKKFYALLKRLNHELELTLVLVSHDSNIIINETTEIACVNKTLLYEKCPKNMLQIQFHNH